MKSFEYYSLLFEEHLAGRKLSASTIRHHRRSVRDFARFARGRDIADVRAVTEDDISAYMAMLATMHSKYHRPYAAKTITGTLECLAAFFRFLVRNDCILVSPMERIDTEVRGIAQRRELFSVEELARFLDAIATGTPDGLRDRAFFELLYSSGLRVSEAQHLDTGDIDLAERIVRVREGKGGNDRSVPLSAPAAQALTDYLMKGRPAFAASCSGEALFVTDYGRIVYATIRRHFGLLLERAGIPRRARTIHSIRHSVATHLLEAGADVRYVQELLGHESLESTVRYTHMAMAKLKQAYKSAHPRENEYYDEVDEEYCTAIDALVTESEAMREYLRKYGKRRGTREE